MTANLRQSARFAAYFVIAFLLLQYTLESAGAFVIRHAPPVSRLHIAARSMLTYSLSVTRAASG